MVVCLCVFVCFFDCLILRVCLCVLIGCLCDGLLVCVVLWRMFESLFVCVCVSLVASVCESLCVCDYVFVCLFECD